MSNELMQGSKAVIEEVEGIWKDYDPVEGYAAGLPDCKGKMFMPTDEAKAEILRRIQNVRPHLTEIKNPELHACAEKLLNSTSVALEFSLPDEQIVACFLALWFPLLKKEQNQDFVSELLEQALEIVALEHLRWRDQQFNGTTRKACVDACASLEAILIVLASENPKLIDLISQLSNSVGNFRSLFSFPVKDPDSFEELFAFFERNAGSATENKLYPQMVKEVFDYGASIKEIYDHSQKMLADELRLTNELVPRLSKEIGVPPNASLGDAYAAVSKAYEIEGSVLSEARKMMAVLNKFVDKNLQDLGIDPDISAESTPQYLKALITSGTALALNYLTNKPKVHVYVTQEENGSWLTLLNVLVHEATHAYSPLILSGVSSLRTLTKLKSWLVLPFYEATAFHRELELYEAVYAASQLQGDRSATVRALLRLFDATKFPLRDDVVAFELETRIWRVIRALRTICDVEINTGQRTYVDFIKWAANRTQLSKQFIHSQCFMFLSYPGYIPSYSFCGSQYQKLQSEAEKKGVTRFVFNSKANRMGLLPWTLCLEKMKAFAETNGEKAAELGSEVV